MDGYFCYIIDHTSPIHSGSHLSPQSSLSIGICFVAQDLESDSQCRVGSCFWRTPSPTSLSDSLIEGSMATSSLAMFGSSFVACASLGFAFKGLNDRRRDSAEKKLERWNFKDTVDGFVEVLSVHAEVQKLRGLHQAEMWKKIKEGTPK